MKIGNLREYIEILGVASVVASLLFVGMQLKQEQEIAIANQHQARAESSMANRRARMESESYLSARGKFASGSGDNLTPEEVSAYNNSTLLDLTSAENDYYQYLNGFGDTEWWEGKRNRIKTILRDDSRSPLFTAASAQGSNSFRRLIEELKLEIDLE